MIHSVNRWSEAPQPRSWRTCAKDVQELWCAGGCSAGFRRDMGEVVVIVIDASLEVRILLLPSGLTSLAVGIHLEFGAPSRAPSDIDWGKNRLGRRAPSTGASLTVSRAAGIPSSRSGVSCSASIKVAANDARPVSFCVPTPTLGTIAEQGFTS